MEVVLLFDFSFSLWGSCSKLSSAHVVVPVGRADTTRREYIPNLELSETCDEI